MKINDLKNKKIAILGYGKEGKSTEKFLKKIGINDYKILDKSLDENYLKNLGNFDVIFKTPGISPHNNPELLDVKEKIISQAEILADNFEGKIIGITGTKGKSTTSTLLYEILKELGYKVKLVGNIGNPVLDEIDLTSNLSPFFKGSTGNEMEGEGLDYIVYELSSYMLEGLNLNIFAGILNNIYDCHLDWHNGRENYEIAKFNIFKNAKYKLAGYELKNNFNLEKNFKELEFFGLGGKYFYKPHPSSLLVGEGIKGSFYIGDKKILDDENIALAGEHNRKNIAGIIGVLDKIGVFEKKENIEKIKKVLARFTGLPHRQENIGTYKGITFINDAIASTPESAIAAIKTFGEKIGTVFIGNEDSGFDLTELREIIEKYQIPNIVLFPTTGEKLFGDFSKNMNFDSPQKNFILKNSKKGFILKTLSMENAIKFAYENTEKGKIVLLSTGAPSFNADGPGVMPWKSYIEKGEMFKKFVEKYGQY